LTSIPNVDAAAALIGLPLDPAHRQGVILNMHCIADMAALVMVLIAPFRPAELRERATERQLSTRPR
jgi:hypothetical protein